MRRDESGQAAPEYVALLLVLAVLLAAGTAIAVPGVGDRVTRTMRVGLCIVGGDICRSADATAAGLAPCLTGERYRRDGLTVDIAVVRLGGEEEWQIAVASDGTATVTKLEESDAGGTAGIGVSFSPLGVDAELSGALLASYRSGRTWRFPDLTAARVFLERVQHDVPLWAVEPDVTWRALGGKAEGELGVDVRDLAGAGLSISADAALGVRTEGDRRTLALEAELDGPGVFVDLPGYPFADTKRRSAVAEVTWRDGELETLTLRQAKIAEGRTEEYVATLPLARADARAAARALVTPGGAGDPAELARVIARDGALERLVYVTEEDANGFSAGAKVGFSLGVESEHVAGGRRLVDATSWVRGGPPQRRVDCLGGVA